MKSLLFSLLILLPSQCIFGQPDNNYDPTIDSIFAEKDDKWRLVPIIGMFLSPWETNLVGKFGIPNTCFYNAMIRTLNTMATHYRK